MVPILTSEVGSYCKPSNGDAHFTLEGCETIWENASWQNPEAMKLVDQLSKTKAMILKAITENTNDSSKPITDMKNYDLEISSMTLSPQLWPSDSELSELFQSASVTTTSCQMCAEEHKGEPVAVVHSESLRLCARPTTLLLCPRCRLRSRSKCEQEICDRCLNVVSNQWWTNSLMLIVLCHTILWSNAFILWFLIMPKCLFPLLNPQNNQYSRVPSEMQPKDVFVGNDWIYYVNAETNWISETWSDVTRFFYWIAIMLPKTPMQSNVLCPVTTE